MSGISSQSVALINQLIFRWKRKINYQVESTISLQGQIWVSLVEAMLKGVKNGADCVEGEENGMEWNEWCSSCS